MHVLYQDDFMIAVEKPSGFHVHPPEQDDYPVPRSKICLYVLKEQLGRWLFPVHRLDVSTSGVLLFAFNSETARRLCQQFSEQSVQKTYWAVVRGWTPPEALVEIPLESDSSGQLVAAQTRYKRLAKMEIPKAVGKRFKTARYSWLEVKPHSGRYHQIRRHMNRLSHPIVGDGTHGDSHHNRFFREEFGIEGLCLHALHIELRHPQTNEVLSIHSPPREKWSHLQNLFQEFDVPQT